MCVYISKFKRSQRCLRSVGIDISGIFDQDSLGNRLLDRSGLSANSQRMVLVGTQQSLDFERIIAALTLQYPDFRPPPPIVGRDGSSRESNKNAGKDSSSSNSSIASTTTSRPSARPPYHHLPRSRCMLLRYLTMSPMNKLLSQILNLYKKAMKLLKAPQTVQVISSLKMQMIPQLRLENSLRSSPLLPRNSQALLWGGSSLPSLEVIAKRTSAVASPSRSERGSAIVKSVARKGIGKVTP